MTFGPERVHVNIDDEGMRHAASQMSEAADKMQRVSNEMNETLFHFLSRFSEEVTRLENVLPNALLNVERRAK